MPYKDKEKRNAWARVHLEKNREAIYAKNRRIRARNKAALLEYKSRLACSTCGIANPIVLDFHHREGTEKNGTVSDMLTRVGLRTTYAEAAKCIVLCANCHRIHHAVERAKKAELAE